MRSRDELLSMKANGECWVLNSDTGKEFWWPFCTVDGCTNRACLRLNSPKCYPHTLPGVPLPWLVAEELGQRRAQSQRGEHE